MKAVCVVALAMLAVVSCYDTKYDGFNIQTVLDNPVELKAFVACFTGEGECNEMTAHFKKDLGDAIQSKCAKCTDAQKKMLELFVVGLKEKLPEQYEGFKKVYDPESVFLH